MAGRSAYQPAQASPAAAAAAEQAGEAAWRVLASPATVDSTTWLSCWRSVSPDVGSTVLPLAR